MGRSKFPGKPSKSVMKERIRVLTRNESDRKLNKRSTEDSTTSSNNSVNSDTITKKKKQLIKDVNTNPENAPLQSNPGSSSSSKLEQETTNEENPDDKTKHIKKNCSNDLLEQNQEKTMSFTGDNPETLKSSSPCVGNIKPFPTDKSNHVKKKTVTFKNILETSDDILISRSIHNPLNKGPLVSIMKKDCMRSQRYMPRKDRIVRPSRLTKILKNNANIDKTKFLSFRSVHLPMSHEYKNHLDEEDDNYSSACQIFLTGEEGKINEHKLKDHSEDGDNSDKLTSEKRYKQLTDKWNMQKLLPHTENFEMRDENAGNDSAKQPSKKKDSSIILRQPRLLFETQEEISEKSKQNVSVDVTEPNVLGTKLCNNAVCGVCSTPVNYKNIQQSRKYGITACEFCRTFISKITKKTVAASPNSSKVFKIQCIKKEGECSITSLSKNNLKSFKKIYDERCSACWLKKCIKSFHFPSGHKLRLSSLISETHNKDVQSINKSQEALHFKNAIELLSEKCNNDSQTNLFSWKRPSIPVNGINESAKSHQEHTVLNNNSIENQVNGNITTDLFSKASCSSEGGVNTRQNVQLNKNSREIPNKSIELPASSITTSEYPKRQKIAFKGPRVKHVCRSASIALGQQMATFSSDNDETFPPVDCNSEIENINNDLSQQMVPEVKQVQILLPEKQAKCIENADNVNVIKKALEIKRRPTLEIDLEVDEENLKVTRDGKHALNTVKNNHKSLGNKCGRITNLFAPSYGGNKNSAPKRNLMRLKSVPLCENRSKMVSIDFWDTYVPAEVNQTGFGLILTKSTSVFALCFLCGSMDPNDLLFCVCCCEPYHSYCIQEAYTTDDAELFDKKEEQEESNECSNQLNWMCPRCTVCDTCNMSSGAKIKCQKCKKNYHNTCMGTSKGLLGADRPLICRSCLKCQFCSSTKVSKYVGNQPTCIQCFMQRRSLSTCSLCQKCVVDSVLEVIILECGVCNELIHAKCEGLTEEQTNLLSSISENIKFVCNKCSLSNNKSKTLAKQWREAVCKELKSRLLQVLKLLSKSRLADILKKSTVKTSSCRCGFDKDKISKDHHTKEDSNGCYKYKFNNIIGSSTFQSKCLCSKSNIPQQTNNNLLSLLDIKRKIVNGEYVSLFDFNADMNDVITPLKNDELILTYKEIISEKFSWFQNETKTCTDALEEDMFDACNYAFQQNENIIAEDENLSTKLPLLSCEEKIFTPLKQNIDKRICIFCLKEGDGDVLQESRLLYYGFDSWVHVNCALWSMDVYEEFDGSLQNVHSAFVKGKSTKCTLCGNSGATIKCNVKTCCNYYHFQCARKSDCLFEYETSMFCSFHSTDKEKSQNNLSNEVFRVSRPLYIECNKSHRMYVEPFKVQFMLGSLSVIQLGTICLPFSDTSEAIVPINFICTRLYWSSKEPWKVIKYRVRTSIQNSSITLSNEHDRHFTVDHSKNRRLVERDLTQISFWHNTLIRDDNIEAASLNNEHNYLNNLRFSSSNIDYRNEAPLDSFIEEEPQNNSDLLPPEIEEAIFKDLPNDILDGISMLDIFPKLMIHEDQEAIEGRLEKINESSENSTSQTSSDCLLLSSLKKQDFKSFTQKHDLQNSNSECSLKNGNDSQQRSSNVSWAFENRRLTKDIFDLNFSETRAFNLNSVKFEEKIVDCKLNSKKNVYSEENKNLSQFMRENIKLMQLDGADDHIAGYLSTQTINANSKNPVKCDRCHCTYRTFDSFQRHFVNCEQISASESETETTSRSPDSVNSIIIVKDELNKDNLQLYQNQFLGSQNISTNNMKAANSFNTFSTESIIPQNIANTASFYVHIDKGGYGSSSICGMNVNTLNNSNDIKEKINYNKTNITNSTIKNEQCKLFAKIKEDTVINEIKNNKTANESQDKNNYLQLLNQNLMFSDQYAQKEQQQQQHPQQQQFVIIQQNAGNSQPMLIHQVPNTVQTMPQNIFPVVLQNNSVQYASVPAFTNSLMPAPLWHSDCNMMLSSGLQMMPMPSLQLASPSPQLVGSFNIPQTLQLGSNQVLLGGTSTMDLMPNNNQLLLAPQPMFYGLETIVQNTVMSSQQFVSTAIQGVLSQNASFSATTTQVFQSSKFEPVSDPSTSYVVLNNVDGGTLVVPQTNMLPGYINTNSSHDFQGNYNTDFGAINGQHSQAIIQQSEPNKIFPLIQTLPEIANTTVVKTPTNELQERIRFETSSNTISPAKKIVQSAPLVVEETVQPKSENLLVGQKWIANNTTVKKLENYNSSVSTITSNNFVNDNNFPNAKYTDFFEVQNTRPELNETTSKQKVQITPRNTKRKNNSLSFSQMGLKIMFKNVLQKELKSNQPQDVSLECINSKLSNESALTDNSVPFASSIRKINNANTLVKDEFQNFKDSCGDISEPIKSHPLPNTVSQLESRKSVNLSSTKLPFTTPAFGSNLHNVPTNIVVPIMQGKQSKTTTSRPTNRVLPMQSIHKPSDTSKPKNSVQNRYLVNQNVQSSVPLEAEILKPAITIKKKVEYIKPMKDVLEIENSANTADSSRNHVTLSENLSTKKVTEPITTIHQKEPENIIYNNENPVEKILDIPNPVKQESILSSPDPVKKESTPNIENTVGKEETIPDSYDSVEIGTKSPNNDFSDNNASEREKCIKDLELENGNHETQQLILKDEDDVCNVKLSNPSDQEYIFQNDLENFNKTFKRSNSPVTKMSKQCEADQQASVAFAPSKKPFKVETTKKSTEPYLIFEIQGEDGFSYKSQSISDVWEKVFEAVQSSRRAHGLPSYPIESFADICGVQILGLKTSALRYLIEQLPGIEKCQRYTPKYHENESPTISNVCTTNDVGFNTKHLAAARCEAFAKRAPYDMFSWLASKHRKQPKQIFVQPSDTELIARRCTANLPMAMKYRTLKETCKLNVGVFRSLIHGRGLFCIKDMEAGEMVIEYAGELIRSTLADKRERFYDNKGIGCYMFKIDENFVVDATMRGNAARFINHSCEPNCYSKVVDILGHKHIIIFSLRRIVQGEELTYDYKFPFEDVKIHCYCASKKCRKYLN